MEGRELHNLPPFTGMDEQRKMENPLRDEEKQIDTRKVGNVKHEFIADLIVPTVRFSALRGQMMPSSDKIRFRAETYESIHDSVMKWFRYQQVNVETELLNELLTMFWSVPTSQADVAPPRLLGIIVKRPILDPLDTPVVYEAKAVFGTTCPGCTKALEQGQMVYERDGDMYHWDCRITSSKTDVTIVEKG